MNIAVTKNVVFIVIINAVNEVNIINEINELKSHDNFYFNKVFVCAESVSQYLFTIQQWQQQQQ